MERLDSEKVYQYIGKSVRTTQDIAKRFNVRAGQAAAAIAILRIKGTVVPATPKKDPHGVSRWCRTASASAAR